MMKKKKFQFWLVVALLVGGLLLAACSSTGGSEPAADDETMEEMNQDDMEDMENMEDMDHDDMEENRIPNQDGATITITSPNDGDTANTLDQIIVEVDVANFELGVDGSHWHVYVDGTSFGMVMGGNTDQALPGLDPGEHEISVYLAIGTHEEFEDGSSVTIIVVEE